MKHSGSGELLQGALNRGLDHPPPSFLCSSGPALLKTALISPVIPRRPRERKLRVSVKKSRKLNEVEWNNLEEVGREKKKPTRGRAKPVMRDGKFAEGREGLCQSLRAGFGGD